MRCELLYHQVILDSQAKYKPCCLQEGWDIPPLLEASELIQTQPYVSMREQMAGGHWPSQCAKCEMAEMRGYLSHRQRIEGMYADTPQDVKLTSLEVRTNLCNLKCHTCNPKASSSLIPIYAELNKIRNTSAYVDVIPPAVNVKRDIMSKVMSGLIDGNITHFTFIGGEPLLDPTTMETFERIIQHGECHQLELDLITNLMIAPELFERYLVVFKSLIPSIKKLRIQVSCDGFGSACEFTRDGFSWKMFESNIRKLQEYLGVELSRRSLDVSINSVMVIPMLDTIQEYLTWCQQTLHPGIQLKFGEYQPFDPFKIKAMFLNDIRMFTAEQLGDLIPRFVDVLNSWTDHPNVKERQRLHAIKYVNECVGIHSDCYDIRDWVSYSRRRIMMNNNTDWLISFCSRYPFFSKLVNV